VTIRKFALISEADARTLDLGSTVELEPGGQVTPLAMDTLRDRRITVVSADGHDPRRFDDVAPQPVRRLAIGSDHTGLALKSALLAYLRRAGLAVTDVGTDTPDPVDYPDIAGRVGVAVARREADAGIVIDADGIGSAIAANKVRGVRAALCDSVRQARHAREHNGANVLTLGATWIDTAEAIAIVDAWRSAATTEVRYLRRLFKIRALEDRF
jgi:ribose 5-phosphate isomerase B